MSTIGEAAPKTKGLLNRQFKILPATLEDAEAIQRCSNRAFSSNYLTSQIYPKEKAHLTSPEELFAFRVKRLRKALAADDALHFKIIKKDQPDEIIAFCGWNKPGHFKPGFTLSNTFGVSSTTASQDNAEPHPASTPNQQPEAIPACMTPEVQREFLAKRDEQRTKIWGEDTNYWYLGVIAVDPEYQRQGLATVLMQEGLIRADVEGVPTYLEASPDGALFYPKFGFQKVGEYGFFGGKHFIQFHIRPVGGGIKN